MMLSSLVLQKNNNNLSFETYHIRTIVRLVQLEWRFAGYLLISVCHHDLARLQCRNRSLIERACLRLLHGQQAINTLRRREILFVHVCEVRDSTREKTIRGSALCILFFYPIRISAYRTAKFCAEDSVAFALFRIFFAFRRPFRSATGGTEHRKSELRARTEIDPCAAREQEVRSHRVRALGVCSSSDPQIEGAFSSQTSPDIRVRPHTVQLCSAASERGAAAEEAEGVRRAGEPRADSAQRSPAALARPHDAGQRSRLSQRRTRTRTHARPFLRFPPHSYLSSLSSGIGGQQLTCQQYRLPLSMWSSCSHSRQSRNPSHARLRSIWSLRRTRSPRAEARAEREEAPLAESQSRREA